MNTEVAWGDQAPDQAAKRAALQNNDLIGIATLVPQSSLPETPSYTEAETHKAKSEGFQEWFMEIIKLCLKALWLFTVSSNKSKFFRI